MKKVEVVLTLSMIRSKDEKDFININVSNN